jgi:hypothetical protein
LYIKAINVFWIIVIKHPITTEISANWQSCIMQHLVVLTTILGVPVTFLEVDKLTAEQS